VFQFDETRVFHADSNAFPEYYPPNARPQESCAFVYFAARKNRPSAYLDTNGNLAAYTDPRFPSGSATPYYYQPPNQAPPNPPRFMKDDTYQIVWAGIDNDYGAYAAKFFPTGQGYASTDNDNLTSFAKGRLGDSQ
jgi:hypothetical protein